jgi:hypothetical protein
LKIDKSVDNLSDRLDRIEEEITEEDSSKNTSNNPDPELEKLSPMERYILRFNWYVREIMPDYKAEVMQVHNIATDEEYTRCILEGDESIYLPQPNRKFFPTTYKERVAHVLGLDHQGLQDKIARGEIKVMIANGLAGSSWRDEDPNAVF